MVYHVDRENRVAVTRGEWGDGRGWEGETGRGNQLYGDGWKLNFWW